MNNTKHLIFSYGSLILPENLEKFKSKILKSVFIKGFDLEITKSQTSKTNYHYIQLIEGKNIIPGFLIETENIELIDKWEGNSYKRVKIKCFTRNLEKIECFTYIKNI
jgi:hypothetical protein